MINKLHLAMIELALNAYHSIFKTECGKKICKEMFGIGQSEISVFLDYPINRLGWRIIGYRRQISMNVEKKNTVVTNFLVA